MAHTPTANSVASAKSTRRSRGSATFAKASNGPSTTVCPAGVSEGAASSTTDAGGDGTTTLPGALIASSSESGSGGWAEAATENPGCTRRTRDAGFRDFGQHHRRCAHNDVQTCGGQQAEVS